MPRLSAVGLSSAQAEEAVKSRRQFWRQLTASGLWIGGVSVSWAAGVPSPDLRIDGADLPLKARRRAEDFAASWRRPDGRYESGWIRCPSRQQAVQFQPTVALPTRAHAVTPDGRGGYLVVARRPGDWMLRLSPTGRALQQVWAESDRVFNGHAVLSADARVVYTTETRLDDAQGVLGVRDALTLRKQAEWPTHGIDPHAVVLDDQGHCLVANGGIATLPETGRTKWAAMPMDASVVRLHRDGGVLLAQWRLDDARLSPRHLYCDPQGQWGVALQSEHDDAQRKQAAPVMAWPRGDRLIPAPQEVALAGYGGDILALGALWAVSCPKANGVAWWRAGQWWGHTELKGACALAAHGDAVWIAGTDRIMAVFAQEAPHATRQWALPVSPQGQSRLLDNHWLSG